VLDIDQAQDSPGVSRKTLNPPQKGHRVPLYCLGNVHRQAMAYNILVTSLPEFNIDLETLYATLPLQRLLTDSLVLGTILRQTNYLFQCTHLLVQLFSRGFSASDAKSSQESECRHTPVAVVDPSQAFNRV